MPGMKVSTGFAVAVAICILCNWATSAGAASMVAQSAVGRPFAPGCDPWDPIKSLLNPRSLNDSVAVVMLDVLTKHVVPFERQLETPVQFSFVYLMHGSWWDALAPFNDTAKPILPEATLPRWPAEQRTNTNMNTVWLYTLLRVAEWYLPAAVPGLQSTMAKYKLDHREVSKDPTTMAGAGNFVADVWVKFGQQDGLNRAGTSQHTHNKGNYSDDTYFVPSNTAFSLENVTKWQPLLETNDLGYFFVQHHITPQIRNAIGYSVNGQKGDLKKFQVAGPQYPENAADAARVLKQSTDEVLAASAVLTDQQKLHAEFFDDKLVSLAPVAYWLGVSNRWDVHTLLGATMAMSCVYDATITSWAEKIRHNGVRPVSLVRHFYNNQTIKAYAGPNQGTQDIKGNEYSSYMRTMPHAEYPSGSSAVCGAYGAFMKKFLGQNMFSPPVRVSYPKGCSRREPGLTPAQALSMVLTDIDAMVKECGMSRLYAGVHFMPSIEAGWELGAAVGEHCFQRYQELAARNATAAAAPPSASG